MPTSDMALTAFGFNPTGLVPALKTSKFSPAFRATGPRHPAASGIAGAEKQDFASFLHEPHLFPLVGVAEARPATATSMPTFGVNPPKAQAPTQIASSRRQASSFNRVWPRNYGQGEADRAFGNGSTAPTLFERRWTFISSPERNEVRSGGRTARASAWSKVLKKRVS